MRFGDLKKLIGDMIADVGKAGAAVGDLLPGGGQQQQRVPLRDQVRSQREQAQKPRSVDDEVAAALKNIEADKERERKEQQLTADITDLKERTKEKAPVERGRLHKLMGWGD
jgi:hypothetical protein